MKPSILRTAKARACLIVLLISISMPCVTSEPTGRINCFVIGHSEFVWGLHFRILFMRDPLFNFNIYPLPPDYSYEDKRKLDRVYYPRTRELLIEKYDLMVFQDARIEHFIPRQIHDLDHAFREEGMVAMSGLCISWERSWAPTILSDVLPISWQAGLIYGAYTVDISRGRDPVLTPFIDLGCEKVFGTQLTTMTVRQGAIVWGIARPRNFPWLVSWRPGGTNAGLHWVVAHVFDSWWSEETNPYSLDVATNMIFYSLGEPLISDIHARREARELFSIYYGQTSLVLSLVDWADRFGVNTIPLTDSLLEIEREMEGSLGSYFEQDYPATISFLESLSPRVARIAEEAVILKNEAMFWIFLSEWLVVTSAGIIAGFVLWSLMIKRKMFREIESTRYR